MRKLTLCTIACLALATTPRASEACGALVSESSNPVTAGGQRVVVAVGADVTDIIAQVTVPNSGSDYGVLLPVPAKPTISSEPISSDDLDKLESATRPRVTRIYDGGGGGGGIGCGASDASGGPPQGTPLVKVIETVNVGPIDATVLLVDQPAGLDDWLSQHGFVVPSAQRATLDSYIKPGGYVIAFKRASTATSAAASSVAVRFTMAGRHLGYPLRLSRIGAASELAITVFVVDNSTVRADAPFTTLTLDDLGSAAAEQDYRAELRRAVAERKGKALVIEGQYETRVLSATLDRSGQLNDVLLRGSTLTRLTTIVTPDEMTDDIAFVAAPELSGAVPNEIRISGAVTLPPTARGSALPAATLPYLLLALLLLYALRKLTRRQRARGRV